jgi:hypothetical protein
MINELNLLASYGALDDRARMKISFVRLLIS